MGTVTRRLRQDLGWYTRILHIYLIDLGKYSVPVYHCGKSQWTVNRQGNHHLHRLTLCCLFRSFRGVLGE